MAKFIEMHRLVGNYLELHGDKEVTSIASWNSSSEIEYTLNLHDIHKGSIGTNPYTGLMKSTYQKQKIRKKCNLSC